MYIRYNNNIYELINYKGKKKITTYFNDKCDNTFEKTWDYYAKEYLDDNTNVQDIFNVDFMLTYIDTSETTKHGIYMTRWNVNEGRPIYKNPVIENDEIGLSLSHDSWSEDWIQDDKYSCSKIVNINECSNYTIVFTYWVKNIERVISNIIQNKGRIGKTYVYKI